MPAGFIFGGNATTKVRLEAWRCTLMACYEGQTTPSSEDLEHDRITWAGYGGHRNFPSRHKMLLRPVCWQRWQTNRPGQDVSRPRPMLSGITSPSQCARKSLIPPLTSILPRAR